MDSVKVAMPYGRKLLDVEIPERNFQKVYTFAEPAGLKEEENEIREKLKNPTGTSPLSSLFDQHDKISIIISDITRPVPSCIIVPLLLEELSDIPLSNITCVVATGLHRSDTEQELVKMLGAGILKRITVINHDAFDSKNLVKVGKTSRGTKLDINRTVTNSDGIIATGYIEPHEFAGFTGGRKSILPGVAGIDSINFNHRIEQIDHPKARIGILKGNPVHEDMVEAARMVGTDFILNVVLNREKEILKVAAGDVVHAHEEGVAFYRKMAHVEIAEPADIVITSSGYPLDMNFYQSVKSIIAAKPFVREGGAIILLSECEKGIGTDVFYRWMTRFHSPEEILNRMKKEKYRADIDHSYLLARVLQKRNLIVVSQERSFNNIKESLFKVVTSPKEAVIQAFKIFGNDVKIAFVPHAQRILPKRL